MRCLSLGIVPCDQLAELAICPNKLDADDDEKHQDETAIDPASALGFFVFTSLRIYLLPQLVCKYHLVAQFLLLLSIQAFWC